MLPGGYQLHEISAADPLRRRTDRRPAVRQRGAIRFVQDGSPSGSGCRPIRETTLKRTGKSPTRTSRLLSGVRGGCREAARYVRPLRAESLGRRRPGREVVGHDACWGYMIVDEPGAGAFPDLAKRADDSAKASRPLRLHQPSAELRLAERARHARLRHACRRVRGRCVPKCWPWITIR